MTETTVKVIHTINAVDGFNPAEFTRQLPNEDGSTSLYLDVKYRLLWFRLHRPQGKITSDIVSVDDRSAVVTCKLYADKGDPEDQYLAKSSAQRFATTEKFGDRYLEIAETAAIGRVLAACGYGTQFCGAGDMLSGVVADAPVDLMDAEDDVPPADISSTALQVSRGPAQEPEARPAKKAKEASSTAQAPSDNLNHPMTLEDYLNSMSIEDAKNVVIDCGYNSGKTLGEVAMRKPSDLDWYVNKYNGRNLALKAGAILLVSAASQKAG